MQHLQSCYSACDYQVTKLPCKGLTLKYTAYRASEEAQFSVLTSAVENGQEPYGNCKEE